ncbi:MAG: Gfo/Idh/MocA family oxidoreductase [Kofleriaceae bacterium]
MIRIGVIGAGAWGLNHIRVLDREPGCTLGLVADPDRQVAARVHALAPTARIVEDADHLLADPSIDAVVIATPAPTHFALARAALRAGKHILVEKPVSMSLAEAIDLAALARETHKIGMVGHLMVYHPAVVQLRELLTSGALGKLHYLHSTRVNLGRLRRDESTLWSFGPHDLSMIDFLLAQSPQSVSARGQRVLQAGIEDVVFLTLRYATGELAHVHLSWLSPRKERRLTIVCSQKMVEFDDVAVDKLRICDKGYDRASSFTQYAEYLTIRDGDVFIPQLSMQEPLQLQLQHFVACIQSDSQPITSLESGARVIAILEAAQRSIELDGVPVELGPLDSRIQHTHVLS